MPAPALAIRRFALTVAAPAAGAAGAASLATEAVREHLADALGERLAGAPDDRLLLIRRVELDLTLTAGESSRRIADRIADALVAAIERGSAAGAGAEPAMNADEPAPFFASPSARVAAFLATLADGRGGDAWWFRSFEGVRLLPASAAARTILLRDAAAIATVFAAIDPAARHRLVALLDAADAALLLDALADLPSAPAGDGEWIALAGALRRASASAALPRAVEALMILAANGTAPIGGAVAGAARAASLFLAGAPPRRSGPRAIARRGVAGDTAGPERRTARLPRALRAALLAPPEETGPADAFAPLFSPFGGYAMLLPALLEIDLTSLSREWPDLEDCAPESILQLLILAAAAGERRLLDDPFWRALLALPPRLTLVDLADWLNSASPLASIGRVPGGLRGVALPAGLGPPRIRRAIAALARKVLRRFAGRLPGFASASAAFLRTNLLGAGATLEIAGAVVQVRLERPPLDVLLAITGAGERELLLPGGRPLRLERRG